ncbi:Ubiquitin-conjugating enzyme E2C-binding protein [Penicillium cf. griseofulvum]|uniref:Ubiquitin-conjugating enzyme E2C-binding protein n=1 Tax=Penicillium cf. griseofulvum TaxID=2972120 RepID=A0A9W9MZM5_9EURO|nr:Ubiquitin-conjugating enzyme E2C-binding protein [Penicillium cf. griseofulvum]KAJ5421855.1 Ubiquitin-conjugating enzyme E2C-binding protein [Penicillium cf. griseofulvum]
MQDADIPLYLHAEFLPNIRQITLYISLPGTATFNGVRPDIQLSESRKAVTVSLSTPFEYVTETIKLPARVNDASRRVLKTISGPAPKSDSNSAGNLSYDFSFRMQVDPDEEVLAPQDELINEFVPWTAEELSSSTRIRCRGCEHAFLDSSSISKSVDQRTGESPALGWIWKDLPSGNWAEMMDFWHCHKPDPHEGHEKDEKDYALQVEDQTAQTKGYGADSHVVAISGTVFVDVATFLLAETDCTGLKKGNEEEQKSNTQVSAQRTLDCTNCNAIIGMEDPTAKGWRLLKSNVSLNTNSPSCEADIANWEVHPTETIVAAQLLELIERESARRFVVHCGQKSGLVLWVFNPDIRYSNSSPGCSIMAQQAMKVFYQKSADVDELLHPEIGNPSPLSVEELELPSMTFEAMSQALTRSNEMLPLSARRFNEWDVGLLGRFRREKL